MTLQLFGEHFKKLRQTKGLTLRAFCREYNYDPGLISKVERGKISIPGAHTVEKWAVSLDLVKGSPGWLDFMNLAAVCAGKIPESIMSDEELLPKLPLVFRKLNGQKLTEKECLDLAEIMRQT